MVVVVVVVPVSVVVLVLVLLVVVLVVEVPVEVVTVVLVVVVEVDDVNVRVVVVVDSGGVVPVVVCVVVCDVATVVLAVEVAVLVTELAAVLLAVDVWEEVPVVVADVVGSSHRGYAFLWHCHSHPSSAKPSHGGMHFPSFPNHLHRDGQAPEHSKQPHVSGPPTFASTFEQSSGALYFGAHSSSSSLPLPLLPLIHPLLPLIPLALKQSSSSSLPPP